MTFYLQHEPSNQTIARLTRASTWWSKGIGVIGRRALPPGEGLWMPGVSAIHTVFVGFPLDILFLNSELKTLRAIVGVPPWRLLVCARGAHHTIELGAGTLVQLSSDVKTGDKWRIAHDD